MRVLRHVASGGFCSVYLAETADATAVVALKVDKASPPPWPKDRATCTHTSLREVAILRKLSPHENVVQATASGERWIALEWKAEGDLTSLLTTMHGPPRAHMAQRLGLDITRGLAHCHRNGVLHLDMKPDNVLLWRDQENQMRACITDFGLSKELAVGRRVRFIGGTVEYTPPELGQLVLGPELDAWGLGQVLFALADCSNLTTREEVKARAWHVVAQRIDPLRARDVKLWSLLRGLTQLQPAIRFTVNAARAHPYFRNVRAHDELLGEHRGPGCRTCMAASDEVLVGIVQLGFGAAQLHGAIALEQETWPTAMLHTYTHMLARN